MRKAEMWTIAVSEKPFETTVACPICGYTYTHVKEVFTRKGGDEGGVYPGTQVKGESGERRSALVIQFECEVHHEFEFVIQQHKGENFTSFTALPAEA